MNSETTLFQLVVFDPRVDAQAVRDTLVEELGMHPTDAMRIAWHAPGAIPLKLTQDELDRCMIGLGARDIDAEGWPTRLIPDLGSPRLIHAIDCRAGGFQALGQREEPTHWVPWSCLELISVGTVMEGPGKFRIAKPWRRASLADQKGPSEADTELLLVRSRPILALHIMQQRMNYRYLEQRLETSSSANFRKMLEDLISHAPTATVTDATRSYLVYDRPGIHHFSSSQALLKYTTLALLWRLRRERTAND